MWSRVALYKYLRYQWFNLKLLEATLTTRVRLRICHGCVCTWLSRTLHAALHRPMETTSLQIEPVYLFSKFSSLGNVSLFFILTSSLMFPWCPHTWIFTSVSVGFSSLSYLFTSATVQIAVYTTQTCSTEPARCVTLQFLRPARRSFAWSKKSRQSHHSCVSTEALSAMISVPAQKKSVILWTKP